MLKGIPVGLVLGAILAFVLFRAVEAHRNSTAPAPAPAAGGGQPASSPETDMLKEEISARVAEKSKLASELAELEAKLLAAKGAKKGGAVAADSKLFKNPWSPMAQKLFRLKDKLDDIQKENGDDYRDLMLQFMEIAKELTEERGFELDDFESSPFGSPMLMLAVLEGADPPIDPAELAKASAIAEKAEADWIKAKEKRADVSALEWKLISGRIVSDAMKGIKGGLSPDQQDWFKTGRMWSEDSLHIWSATVVGTPEQVQGQLVEQWTRLLGMNENTSAPLRPLAGQFMREYQDMEDAWKRREAAGEVITDSEKSVGRAELAIAAQKKIMDSMTLTPEQEKALKGMNNSWDLTITR